MPTRVAIIEDEQVLRELLVKKLTQVGFTVSAAVDGEAGLALLTSQEHDVVLLDIVMPKLNGYDVLKVLAEKQYHTPIIIISNSGQAVEVDKALSLGATDFIVKAQITPEEVAQKIHTVLDRAQGKVRPPTKKLSKEEDDISLPAEGLHILIVEDDQFLRELMLTKLKREGFVVTAAVDGKEGLDAVHRAKPDLVLLDVILPGLDGFSVLTQVRHSANPAIAKTPIVLLSNLGQDSDVQKGKQLGANDYLIKSNLTIDEIIKKIRYIIATEGTPAKKT